MGYLKCKSSITNNVGVCSILPISGTTAFLHETDNAGGHSIVIRFAIIDDTNILRIDPKSFAFQITSGIVTRNPFAMNGCFIQWIVVLQINKSTIT